MSSLLVKVVAVLFIMDYFQCYIDARKAIPLLSVDTNDKFNLNPNALSLLKELRSPFRVVAAIGDARIGKSTALNYLVHSLRDFSSERKVEKVFETGDTMSAVTHGVWLSVEEGFLLLDVEGTDVGNDKRTTKLSIFTAFLSSSLMVFMREGPSNHILQFLYKICRVSENVMQSEDMKNFPRLIPVIRGGLGIPEGYSTKDDYIKDAFTKPDSKDELSAQSIIGKYFPKSEIEVFELPYVKNIAKNSANEHLVRAMRIITLHLDKTPEKKTLKGGEMMGGEGLASFAEYLVKQMNDNEDWDKQLPSVILLLEKENCNNGFAKHIRPLLDDALTLEQLQGKRQSNVEKFERVCPLEEEIGVAKEKIRVALEFAEKRKSESVYGYGKHIFTILGGHLLLRAAEHAAVYALGLSDARLKQDIQPLSESEYSVIGLQGVQWVWNEQAEELGLRGIAEGVVAQDVEKVYPWAVFYGHDGYMRVNYLALKIMIKFNSFQ